MMKDFRKVWNDFDRVEIFGSSDTGWLKISVRVGLTDKIEAIQLRSAEDVHDLHYQIGRFLAFLDKAESERGAA